MTLNIENQNVSMEIDTGAVVSCRIRWRDLPNICFHTIHLADTSFVYAADIQSRRETKMKSGGFPTEIVRSDFCYLICDIKHNIKQSHQPIHLCHSIKYFIFK